MKYWGYFSKKIGKTITKNNNFLQVEPLAPFGRVDFGEIKTLLSLEIINDSLAKSLRKTMGKRVPTPPKLENPHAKWAAKPPIFGALFSSF